MVGKKYMSHYLNGSVAVASYGSLNAVQGRPDEKRHLEFFLSQTHARFKSRGSVGSQESIALVYLTFAPQIAQCSSVVRSAISATSAAEENMMRYGNTSDWLIARQQYHFQSVVKAILKGDLLTEELLICCAILFSYSCFTRNFEAAKLHLESGLRMVKEQRQQSKLPLLLAVDQGLHELEKALNYIFPGHDTVEDAVETTLSFQHEAEAQESLKVLIQAMAQGETCKMAIRLAGWNRRFEVSEANFAEKRARLLSSLYNTATFVLRLITTPIDSVVTGTRLFAIDNQFKHVLSQDETDFAEDITLLQRLIRAHVLANADTVKLSNVPTFMLT